MYRLIIACVLALVVGLAGTAMTETPDKRASSWGHWSGHGSQHDGHHNGDNKCHRHGGRHKCHRHDDACTGLSGSAHGLCDAYCGALRCDKHPRRWTCAQLRKSYKRATGSRKFPCDRVACGRSAPQCNGDCPTGTACTSGPENGGPESGGAEGAVTCQCAIPCGEAQAPQCNGACPAGTACSSGPESGGPESGGAEGGPEGATCSCLAPCGSVAAPTCNGACPSGAVCTAGAEGGPEGQGGPEGDTCRCVY